MKRLPHSVAEALSMFLLMSCQGYIKVFTLIYHHYPPLPSVSNTNTHVNFAFQASFDQYMDDKHRVVQAVFSDKRTTKQLNEVTIYQLCVYV